MVTRELGIGRAQQKDLVQRGTPLQSSTGPFFIFFTTLYIAVQKPPLHHRHTVSDYRYQVRFMKSPGYWPMAKVTRPVDGHFI